MILEVLMGKAWLGVARAWLQANKIEQRRVEEGGGLTSFPGFLIFSPRSWKLGWRRLESFRWREVFFVLHAPRRTPKPAFLLFYHFLDWCSENFCH